MIDRETGMKRDGETKRKIDREIQIKKDGQKRERETEKDRT
jgi:hypothetical protein